MANPMFLPRRSGLAGVAMTVLGVARLRAQPAGGQTVIDLSQTPIGPLPPGFVTARTGQGAPGEWSVVADPAAAGGRAIAQTSADQTDNRFPLAICQAVSAANVDATVRFKAIAGRVDRAGGLAIRLIDADNYYVVRANALEDNVNFYRVVKGSRREIKGASAKVASDTWHVLGLKAEADTFSISFNGTTLFTVTDRTFAGAGKVALWTKADSVTRFDSLSIWTRP